jgi:hypothetical protein
LRDGSHLPFVASGVLQGLRGALINGLERLRTAPEKGWQMARPDRTIQDPFTGRA